MPLTTDMALQAAFSVVAALLYGWVGRLVLQREVEGEARRANVLFATWWLGLSIVYVLISVFNLPFALGYPDLALSVTLLNIILVALCAAVWGLLYYLVYLYTGTSKSFWPLTLAYSLFTIAFLYVVAWAEPIGFKPDGQIDYARQLGGAPSIAIGLLFSVPVVLAALAYGSLYFRVKEPLPRYRIGLIAGAFLFQFGWSTVSTALQLATKYPGSIPLKIVQDLVAIVPPLIIVMAFRPPRAIRRRLGLHEAGGA